MRLSVRRSLALALTLLPGSIALWSSPAHGAPDFAAIDPILKSRCTLCHSGPAAPLALRMQRLGQTEFLQNRRVQMIRHGVDILAEANEPIPNPLHCISQRRIGRIAFSTTNFY